MHNDVEIPDYFASLFDEEGKPVSVSVYCEVEGYDVEYSKIYYDVLKGYRDYYEILDVMGDFYENLSTKPGKIFDLKSFHVGVELLSYEEGEMFDKSTGQVCVTKTRIYAFAFDSGDTVTVKFWHAYDSNNDGIDSDQEVISILDGHGEEVDPEAFYGLEGPSPYIDDLFQEPHVDEWLIALCGFMQEKFDVQKQFYQTSEHFRRLIREYYYKLPDDENEVLDIVAKSGWQLKYALNHFKDDKSVVLAAVKNDGMALAHASERLQNDEDIVMAAIGESGQAIKYANERFWADRQAMLVVIQTFGYGLFEYGSEELKKDKELVLLALKNNPRTLQYVDDKLRDEVKLELDLS